MRRNFLPVLGLLSLFVLGSCSAERDPKIASLKHKSIDRPLLTHSIGIFM